MKYLNKNKKDNIIASAILFTLATILVIAGAATAITITTIQSAEATVLDPLPLRTSSSRAPAVVTGDNIYIAWWTNNTENGNEEVMFRASTDDGQTFGDKINLSNSPDTQ